MRITFRFRWVPFLACAAAAALGISLGNWQTRRAEEKEAIGARLAERIALPPIALTPERLSKTRDAGQELEFRRVILIGEFLQDWPIYLDNRPYQGKAGFILVMPFRVHGTQKHVLIERGWLPRDSVDRTRLPPLQTPSGPVKVEGVVRQALPHVLQIGGEEVPRPGAIVQNLAVQKFAEASKIAAAPLVLEQTNAFPDGLLRDWPAPSLGVEKHRGYAFQWYALAAMAVVFFIVTGFRSGTRQDQEK